ncbi:hypothetical protein [Meridianimarinicoccus aquatilis]|uniref:Uncharacterized protein n=1 Tax=Meridianimarinicoccus aquatilis TaxID=2552766 RepID=A0A4R6ATW4_9RHOB|nr:hypothetical protein [Fluviibacterium aquatile]TDL88031.1 hypothetical protein E2L05_09810 [Fluviibacterium aquatile]
MGGTTKIATCCYCGTRAALVLRGVARHELSCATCGAPLHEMKSFKSARPAEEPKLGRPHAVRDQRGPKRPKKAKKRKSLSRKFLSEAFDLIEDIFD